MKDMLEHLASLREQVEKCERLRSNAKSELKRGVFGRILNHYRIQISELENAISQAEKE